MASTAYKVIAQSNPAATTSTNMYTVGSGKAAVISTLFVANIGATDATYRVAIRPAGASLANQHYIAYDIALPAKSTDPITAGITMAATDVLTVYASTANVSFTAVGSEITL